GPGWQREVHDIVVSVVDQEHRRVGSPTFDACLLCAAVEKHAEATRVAILPLLGGHLIPRGSEPGDVLDIKLLVVVADHKPTTVENRKSPSYCDQVSGKFTKCAALRRDRGPIEPSGLVVLRVCVVVAVLAVAELVSGQQ